LEDKAKENLDNAPADVVIINDNINDLYKYCYKVIKKRFFGLYINNNNPLVNKDKINLKKLNYLRVVIPSAYRKEFYNMSKSTCNSNF